MDKENVINNEIIYIKSNSPIDESNNPAFQYSEVDIPFLQIIIFFFMHSLILILIFRKLLTHNNQP